MRSYKFNGVIAININGVDIEIIVKNLNDDLKKNRALSVNKWCDLKGIKRSTLKSRLKKGKYKFDIDNRQYIKSNITDNTTCNITPLQDNIDLDKLKLLLDNADLLIELVKRNNTTSNITINSEETSVKSLRINNEIYERIKKNATDNNISISSIVNRALLDYLKNYL